MFSNARLYSVSLPLLDLIDNAHNGDLASDTSEPIERCLSLALNEFTFSPCTANQLASSGFVSPFGYESLAYYIEGAVFIAVKTQEKNVPASFIAEAVADKAKAYESEFGEKPPRKKKQEWKEEIVNTYLPTAIPRSKTVRAMLDLVNDRVIVDTTTASVAEDVLALLRKALGSLPALFYFDNHQLSAWLDNFGRGERQTEQLHLGSKIKFSSHDDEKVTASFVNVIITSEDVQAHFDKSCVSLELVMPNKLTFSLKDDGSFAGMKFDDSLKAEGEESEDRDASLQSSLLIAYKTLNEAIDLIDVAGATENQSAA